MNEVLFSADTHVESHSSGLSISEYVAIGICSVLLGFIYVSSVLLYLHIRKRRKERKRPTNFDDKTLTTMEEGVVKNNPLLGLGRHFPNQEFSYSTGSDNEAQKDTSKDDKHVTSCHPVKLFKPILALFFRGKPLLSWYTLSTGWRDSRSFRSRLLRIHRQLRSFQRRTFL